MASDGSNKGAVMSDQMLVIILIADTVVVMLCAVVCALTGFYVASEVRKMRASQIRELVTARPAKAA